MSQVFDFRDIPWYSSRIVLLWCSITLFASTPANSTRVLITCNLKLCLLPLGVNCYGILIIVTRYILSLIHILMLFKKFVLITASSKCDVHGAVNTRLEERRRA